MLNLNLENKINTVLQLQLQVVTNWRSILIMNVIHNNKKGGFCVCR